jgi:hypothetical protein
MFERVWFIVHDGRVGELTEVDKETIIRIQARLRYGSWIKGIAGEGSLEDLYKMRSKFN